MKRWNRVAIALAVALAAISLPLPVSTSHASIIGYRPGTGGFGGLGGASGFDALFAAAGDTTVLTDFNNSSAVNAANALWLNGGTNVLNATEQGNLLSFLSAGGRAVYITDRSDGGPWAVSTDSILGPIGADDIITGGDNANHPTIGAHPLVAGVANIQFNTWSAVNASLASPTLLTANGMAAVYNVGLGQLLFIGDTNWQSGFINNAADNSAFANNIVSWLTPATASVPEPATFTMFGVAALGLVGAALRRRTRTI
jgi:hypothetical protein